MLLACSVAACARPILLKHHLSSLLFFRSLSRFSSRGQSGLSYGKISSTLQGHTDPVTALLSFLTFFVFHVLLPGSFYHPVPDAECRPKAKLTAGAGLPQQPMFPRDAGFLLPTPPDIKIELAVERRILFLPSASTTSTVWYSPAPSSYTRLRYPEYVSAVPSHSLSSPMRLMASFQDSHF